VRALAQPLGAGAAALAAGEEGLGALLADKPLLTAVLTYHVLPAKVERAQVPLGQPVTTVQGGIFKVDSVGRQPRHHRRPQPHRHHHRHRPAPPTA
jgi:hypothetical protein